MKHSTKRSLALLCCLTALLMCGCKGGAVSEANSDSLPASAGATAETVSETQPAPASTTAETESDSESASEDTTAEMPSGSPADMGTAIKSEDGKRNAQLLVDYFYGNWQCAGSDDVMEINDGIFYPALFGVKGLYIDGSVVTFYTMSSGYPFIYKLDTAAPDKMQMSSLTGVYNDVERWSEREYTRVGEPEKTNVIRGAGLYRLNQQYGIPYKTLWPEDYTDDDGTLWTNDLIILNSESEDKLELTAQLYREVPSLPDDEYISVNYTVEKNGDVWERTPAVIQPASEDTTAEMPSGSPADMGTAIKSEDGKRNAQLLVDYFYGNWQPSDNDGVMEIISDGSFYPAWFGVKGVYIDGSIVTFFTLSSGYPIIYKLDTAAPDKMQMSSLTGVYNDVERWSEREYTRAGEPEKTNVIWGVGKYRINQQYGIPYKTLWLLDYTDDDGTLWTTERLILNSESEDKLELTAQCYREVPSMPDDEYISVNYTVEKNGGVWERTMTP